MRRRCCCAGGGGGCCIPTTNLTLTIVNSLIGTFTTPLIYDAGTGVWASACWNQLTFRMSCTVELTVSNYVGGPCPTGSPVACALTLTSQSCSPFIRVYKPTSCPAISSAGYVTFTVTP